MLQYYTFIAKGVKIEESVWTEPYDDAFEYGQTGPLREFLSYDRVKFRVDFSLTASRCVKSILIVQS